MRSISVPTESPFYKAMLKTIVVKTISNVGAQPHGVAFTPDGRFAYITCESVSGTYVHHPATESSVPGTTAVIDVMNNHTKIKDIEMASYPAGISITK